MRNSKGFLKSNYVRGLQKNPQPGHDDNRCSSSWREKRTNLILLHERKSQDPAIMNNAIEGTRHGFTGDTEGPPRRKR
jgi:hypothetical protein